MKFVKIETSGSTTRWINLAHVSRVTLADESGDQSLMVLVFSDGHRESQLKLNSQDPQDKRAIEQLTANLDAAAGA